MWESGTQKHLGTETATVYLLFPLFSPSTPTKLRLHLLYIERDGDFQNRDMPDAHNVNVRAASLTFPNTRTPTREHGRHGLRCTTRRTALSGSQVPAEIQTQQRALSLHRVSLHR